MIFTKLLTQNERVTLIRIKNSFLIPNMPFLMGKAPSPASPENPHDQGELIAFG